MSSGHHHCPNGGQVSAKQPFIRGWLPFCFALCQSVASIRGRLLNECSVYSNKYGILQKRLGDKFTVYYSVNLLY